MKQYFGIGIMSGTSLDGLDLCYARFWEEETWHFEILHAETYDYSNLWKEKLLEANELTAPQLLHLNAEYGFFIGDQVQRFRKQHQIKNLDFIASHGHTVFHQPQNLFTCQIGDGRAIVLRTGITTIYDFRSADVLMGGNGAPLVPIGDRLLFSQFDACLNLGGFSNISFEKSGQRIAFDICPVNFVLNRIATKLNLNYDKDGDIARSNSSDLTVFHQLNHFDFYQKQGAKSLGSEWVAANIDPILKDLKPETAIATFTEHAALQISNVLNKNSLENVLVTGGGAYNSYLVERIQELTKTKLILPDSTIIDFKEALIFAFMGLLRVLGKNNVLASATGAPDDHCAGLVIAGK